MNSYKIDIPVALIFFNRPDTFEKVFKCIREQKPSILFLIQDGPRMNKPSDAENVAKCRQIAEGVDWDCTVYKDYSNSNLGCGKRVFSGLSNAFKIVDRLVIIEDDILISDTFLPFCQELLEKYKDDKRINQISGMNHFGIYEDCNRSYFFSRGGAIWGWATWRRVWQDLEWDLTVADDEYVIKTLSRNMYPINYGKYLADRSKHLRDLIKDGMSPSFWSFHFLLYSYLENRINIVPKYNMISNIGLTADSVHSSANLRKIPKALQVVYFAKRYNIEFPLNHPKHLLDDRYYKYQQDFIMNPTGIRKFARRIEAIIRRYLF